MSIIRLANFTCLGKWLVAGRLRSHDLRKKGLVRGVFDMILFTVLSMRNVSLFSPLSSSPSHPMLLKLSKNIVVPALDPLKKNALFDTHPAALQTYHSPHKTGTKANHQSPVIFARTGTFFEVVKPICIADDDHPTCNLRNKLTECVAVTTYSKVLHNSNSGLFRCAYESKCNSQLFTMRE